MIRALVTGVLVADPQPRTVANGKPFALARVAVPQGDEGRVFCSVICFDDSAVARLLQLRAGAQVSMAGTLKAGVWTDKEGAAHPSLDLLADEVASVTPRPRRSRRDRAGTPDADAGGSHAHE